MAEKKFKKVCRCENCGNEAEMMVTCSLEEVEKNTSSETEDKVLPSVEQPKKVKGHAVCSHCGNEADMWVDL
jgi:DNA-directed RNA polymerase subunit M/transcription elongation factor TFIIS